MNAASPLPLSPPGGLGNTILVGPLHPVHDAFAAAALRAAGLLAQAVHPPTDEGLARRYFGSKRDWC